MNAAQKLGAKAGKLDGEEAKRNGAEPSSAPNAYFEEASEAFRADQGKGAPKAPLCLSTDSGRRDYIAAYQDAMGKALR